MIDDHVLKVRELRCAGSGLYCASGGKEGKYKGYGTTIEGAIGALLIGFPDALDLNVGVDPAGVIFFRQAEKIRLKWCETEIAGTKVYAVKAWCPGDKSSEDAPSGSGSSPAEALGNLVKDNLELFGIAPG